MRTRETQIAIAAEATPASAISAVGSTIPNLWKWDSLTIDATITGGTGGTLDVYLQREVASGVWVDWIHFPQVAATTTKYYACTITGQATAITEVGKVNDAGTGTPVLAANALTNILPTGRVRLFYTAGAGTTVAGAVTLYVTPFTSRY